MISSILLSIRPPVATGVTVARPPAKLSCPSRLAVAYARNGCVLPDNGRGSTVRRVGRAKAVYRAQHQGRRCSARCYASPPPQRCPSAGTAQRKPQRRPPRSYRNAGVTQREADEASAARQARVPPSLQAGIARVSRPQKMPPQPAPHRRFRYAARQSMRAVQREREVAYEFFRRTSDTRDNVYVHRKMASTPCRSCTVQRHAGCLSMLPSSRRETPAKGGGRGAGRWQAQRVRHARRTARHEEAGNGARLAAPSLI